ncbi:UDP-N-acetylmuramoyl-L-alanine--D-glutamate ligase [Candidatus Pelagibacter sp. HIMB1483]|uniref:UDP-N-acetylmuramoyl-L-alanine--D-glutamate ligase n=1 Tax=Candidatus Pelagibacter sp. HIMB1483 TaxID=3415414 RepID=UPI003F8259B5
MKNTENIFSRRKILIYGLGKSGISSYKFLKKKADVYLFDDNLRNNLNLKKKLISFKKISKLNFERIIISPGIDILKCRLSKYLKKNLSKIYTDLDVFYSFYKNKSIAITGTNGKSTTAKILFDILLDQKKDVRLIGNIGNPALSEKKITKKTIFVIEVSSYQLEYSKMFTSKYAAILNISADHIERHKSLKKYVDAKFKLIDSQTKESFAYIKKDDKLINKKLKLKKFNCKIIKIDVNKNYNFFKKIKNSYFFSESNKENLSFVLEISKKLKLKKHLILKTIQKFKGLKYRQQIIFQSNSLTIINDSKSTSFASSIDVLKSKSNIMWLLGGVFKKGDKLNLRKKDFKNVRAFIYGKNKIFFNNELKGKVKFKNFIKLNDALKNVFKLIKLEKLKKNVILFSPCAASFDSFKNFEDRGHYFNQLIKQHLNGK